MYKKKREVLNSSLKHTHTADKSLEDKKVIYQVYYIPGILYLLGLPVRKKYLLGLFTC